MGFTDLVGVEDDVERFGEDRSDSPILIDVDLDEECLVAEPVGLVVTSGVDAGDVRSELKTVVDVQPGFVAQYRHLREPKVCAIVTDHAGSYLAAENFRLYECALATAAAQQQEVPEGRGQLQNPMT